MVINTKKALLKAKSYLKRGMSDQARLIYNQILETYPNNGEARRSLERINSIVSVAEILPAQSYLLKLKNLFEQGRFKDVVACSKTASLLVPLAAKIPSLSKF